LTSGGCPFDYTECDNNPIVLLENLMDIRVYGRTLAFPSYLEDVNGMGCQDPRDRIYATAGLVDWSGAGQLPPEPDYTIKPLS